MKILVTGGNGFIGSHLVERIIRENHEPVCLVRKRSNLRWLKDIKDITYLNYDLQNLGEEDIDFLAYNISDVDIVVHCASAVKALNYKDYYKSNVVTTRNLLQAFKLSEKKKKKFILVSSQAAAGPSNSIAGKTEDDTNLNPKTSYGKTKLIAEQEALKFKNDFKVIIIAPSSVYGPRDIPFGTIFKNASRGIFTSMGGLDKYVSMVYVSDLIDAIFLAIKNNVKSGEKFFISDGEVYSLHSIKACLDKAVGKKTRLINAPEIGGKILGNFLSFISMITRRPSFLNKEKVKEILEKYQVVSTEKAKRVLGYNPKVKLEEGFIKTAKWYKENKWI